MNNDIQLTSVDQLGILLAQIADLTSQADAIKDSIKEVATNGSNQKVFEGNLFKATFSESNRKVVDYKALLADLQVTSEQLSKYTKISAVFSVKTTAR